MLHLSRTMVRSCQKLNDYNVLLLRSQATASLALERGIAWSKDKRTIICWHPEKEFPYECSLPLPAKTVPIDSSVLKVQSSAALKAIRRPKPEEIQRQELMNITYTTKHIWFPCSRSYKKKKMVHNRPYL